MGVEFDEENFNSTGTFNRPVQLPMDKVSKTPILVSFLMKIHIAKDETTARWILLTITVLSILVSIYFFKKGLSEPDFIGNLKDN